MAVVSNDDDYAKCCCCYFFNYLLSLYVDLFIIRLQVFFFNKFYAK
jgi:hypothetical protein